MVIDEISSTLEKRRAELIEMLQNKDYPLEKQHQLYGAINEIDLFLKTLNFYQKTTNNDTESIKLVKPPEKSENIISKLFSGFRNKK